MIVTLESTKKVVTLNGTPARVWEGTTESGIKLHAFITRIAVNETEDTTQFNKELQQQKAPSAEVLSIPLRMLI